MRQVKILGGMREFVGKTGEAQKEGRMWRVFLDEPVEIPGVGIVRDDLWEGNSLRTLRQRKADNCCA